MSGDDVMPSFSSDDEDNKVKTKTKKKQSVEGKKTSVEEKKISPKKQAKISLGKWVTYTGKKEPDLSEAEAFKRSKKR